MDRAETASTPNSYPGVQPRIAKFRVDQKNRTRKPDLPQGFIAFVPHGVGGGLWRSSMVTRRSAKKTAERVAERCAFEPFAMSNLRPSDTGVDGAVIWVSAGEFAEIDLLHGPRIKVVLGDKITTEGLRDAVSARLTDPPVVSGRLPRGVKHQVMRFVNMNREVLLRHWNGEIDAKEMLDLLHRI
jgi:hypothetical protein